MPEDYKPQRHEFGTPAAASWAKSMTPGQEGADMPQKEKKKVKEQMDYFKFREGLDELVEGPAYRKRYTNSSGNIRLNTSASRKGIGASVSLRSSNSSGLGWNYNMKTGKTTISLRGTGLRWDFGGKGRGKTGKTMEQIKKDSRNKKRNAAEERLWPIYKAIMQEIEARVGEDPFDSEMEKYHDQATKAIETGNMSDLKKIMSRSSLKERIDSARKPLPKIKRVYSTTKDLWGTEENLYSFNATDDLAEFAKAAGYEITSLAKGRFAGGQRHQGKAGGVWIDLEPIEVDRSHEYMEIVRAENEVHEKVLEAASIIMVGRATENLFDLGVSFLEKNNSSSKLFLSLVQDNDDEAAISIIKKEVGFKGSPALKPSNLGELKNLCLEIYSLLDDDTANELTDKLTSGDVEKTVEAVKSAQEKVSKVLAAAEMLKSGGVFGNEYNRLYKNVLSHKKRLSDALERSENSVNLSPKERLSVVQKISSEVTNILDDVTKMETQHLYSPKTQKKLSKAIAKKGNSEVGQSLQDDSKEKIEKELLKITQTILNTRAGINNLRKYANESTADGRFQGFEKRGILKSLDKTSKLLDKFEKDLDKTKSRYYSRTQDVGEFYKYLTKTNFKIASINKRLEPRVLNKAKAKGKIGSITIALLAFIVAIIAAPGAGMAGMPVLATASMKTALFGPLLNSGLKRLLKKKNITGSEIRKAIDAELKEMLEEFDREVGLLTEVKSFEQFRRKNQL